MRVISGLRKGHKLKSPKGKDTRPTEGRIKETIFNILAGLKEDASVLDLFAGTGSIGIEFLSRGAKSAYFIDKSSESIKTIKENLATTRFLDESLVYKMDSINAIKFLHERKLKFDYIYIDPPYNKHTLLSHVLNSLNKYPIINKNAIIIIEHEKNFKIEEDFKDLESIDCRKYGNKFITFLFFN